MRIAREARDCDTREDRVALVARGAMRMEGPEVTAVREAIAATHLGRADMAGTQGAVPSGRADAAARVEMVVMDAVVRPPMADMAAMPVLGAQAGTAPAVLADRAATAGRGYRAATVETRGPVLQARRVLVVRLAFPGKARVGQDKCRARIRRRAAPLPPAPMVRMAQRVPTARARAVAVRPTVVVVIPVNRNGPRTFGYSRAA